jgi:hypothetical protein
VQLDKEMGLLFLTGDFTAFTGSDSVEMSGAYTSCMHVH